MEEPIITPPEEETLYLPGNDDSWEMSSPESLGWETSLLAPLYESLDANNTRAFLVLKDGKIVIEEYFGKSFNGQDDFDKDKVWYWASAGKTLKSLLVGIAQEEGLLNINDKTSKYLGDGWTECEEEKEEGIRIWHQLTMTSGLDDSYGGGTNPEDLQFLSNSGDRWAYHNGPYTLLSSVLANASGSTFNDYFEEKLASKIGMTGNWVWIGTDEVYFSTPREMARFGLLMLNNGDWIDETIIQDKEYLGASVSTSQNLNKSYGYLWWLNGKDSFMLPQNQSVFPGNLIGNAPADMVSALGKNGQYLSIVPSQNLVVIRMGDNPDDALVPLLYINDIWDQLKNIIPE